MEDYVNYGSELQEFDVEEFLEQSQEREKHRLEEELVRIEEQLEQRDRVHEKVLGEFESRLDWYLDRLEMLYKRGVGKTGERDEMKRQVRQFY